MAISFAPGPQQDQSQVVPELSEFEQHRVNIVRTNQLIDWLIVMLQNDQAIRLHLAIASFHE